MLMAAPMRSGRFGSVLGPGGAYVWSLLDDRAKFKLASVLLA